MGCGKYSLEGYCAIVEVSEEAANFPKTLSLFLDDLSFSTSSLVHA
jgi:hypothetical protein